MIYPSQLKKGDKVMILSPASCIKGELVDGACSVLREWGLDPVVSKHCKGKAGAYSGSISERVEDVTAALADSSVRAILCSRGGYGVVHLIEYLSPELLRKDPKWIIGFSDISVLHAAMVSVGVVSLHAPMAKHLTELGANDTCSRLIRDILMNGAMPAYKVAQHKYNRNGDAEGQLAGGNLAVLCGLTGSCIDVLKKDRILFIEDVGEETYKIERMLYNMRLNGVLPNLRGLIVGQFTDYHNPDRNGDSMEDMISRMVAPYGYPVAYGVPFGHVDDNRPMIEGATVALSVTADGTEIQFKK